jgi:hypothetical protein
LIVFCLALLPAAFIVRLIAAYGVNVPFGDEWSMIPLFGKWNEHHLTFAELFRQHMEHRILFPKLIYIGFAQLTHWNVKAEMFFSVLLCVVTSLCVLGLLQRTVPGSTRRRLWLWAIANLLIFSPAQAENWMWGFQLAMFIPTICLVGSLLILSSAEIKRARFIAASILAIIATFSFGNGLLLWPVIGLYLISKIGSRRWMILWAALFVVVAISYFVGYQTPQIPARHAADALDYLTYFLRFNGNALGQFPLPGRLVLTAVIGATALLLFFGTAALILKRCGVLASPSAPWIAIGLYAISSSLIATFTRVHEGTEQALDLRYSSVSMNLYVALIALIAIASHFTRQARGSRSTFRLVASLEVLFLVAIASWYLAALPGAVVRTSNRCQLRLRGLASLQFCKVIPPSRVLRRNLRINAEFPEFEQNVAVIDRLQLLDPPLRSSDLLYEGAHEPHRSTDEFGQCDTIIRRGSTLFEMSGWAFLPTDDQPAGGVVLAFRSGNAWHAFAFADVNEERPDAAKERGDQYKWSGWRRVIDIASVPKGVREISAWAVDAESADVYRLPGTFSTPEE